MNTPTFANSATRSSPPGPGESSELVSLLSPKKRLGPSPDHSEYIRPAFDSALPSCLKQRLAYNASNQLVYHGFAVPGTGEGDPHWLIVRYTYDASSNVTQIDFSGSSLVFAWRWDQRTLVSYD